MMLDEAGKYIDRVKFTIAKSYIKGVGLIELVNKINIRHSKKMLNTSMLLIIIISFYVLISKSEMVGLLNIVYIVLICVWYSVYCFKYIYNAINKLRWHITSAIAILLIAPILGYYINLTDEKIVNGMEVYFYFLGTYDVI